MDKEQLINKLEKFKNSCQNKGYIIDDLYFDEAYPSMIPTSFVVKMIGEKKWLDHMDNLGDILDKLIDVLWETTDAKTRESVHLLCIYREDERELMKLPSYREAA